MISVNSSGWPTDEDLEELVETQLINYFGTIFRVAVKLSPVYSGALRASWRVSFEAPREDVTDGYSPAAPIRGATFRWPRGFKLGMTVFVSNNQPYAEMIEYGGWSKQAPYGMLRLAIAYAEAEHG
jgi:hypothetical protein